eukprot:gene17124-biopygen8303
MGGRALGCVLHKFDGMGGRALAADVCWENDGMGGRAKGRAPPSAACLVGVLPINIGALPMIVGTLPMIAGALPSGRKSGHNCSQLLRVNGGQKTRPHEQRATARAGQRAGQRVIWRTSQGGRSLRVFPVRRGSAREICVTVHAPWFPDLGGRRAVAVAAGRYHSLALLALMAASSGRAATTGARRHHRTSAGGGPSPSPRVMSAPPTLSGPRWNACNPRL